jgi:hypothetical protein
VSCPSPRFVLCRGERAFVANAGKGTITVLSCGDWKVVDQLNVVDVKTGR